MHQIVFYLLTLQKKETKKKFFFKWICQSNFKPTTLKVNFQGNFLEHFQVHLQNWDGLCPSRFWLTSRNFGHKFQLGMHHQRSFERANYCTFPFTSLNKGLKKYLNKLQKLDVALIRHMLKFRPNSNFRKILKFRQNSEISAKF